MSNSAARRLPFEATLMVRDTCLCLHAQRTARALARLFDEELRPAGLTNGQFSLLMALNRPMPARLADLSHLLAMDRTTLTANLKLLEKRGLAHVAVDTADRRGRLLSLTEAGHAALLEALPIWKRVHKALDRKLKKITPDALRAGMNALA